MRLGLGVVAKPILGGCGAILVLHRVCAPDPRLSFAANRRNCVTPEHLRRLITGLIADGVDLLPLDMAAERLAAAGRVRPFACLTFDDGYRDNLETLLPILNAFGVPATIYVTPGLIDGTAPLWWYGLDLALRRATRLRLPLADGGAVDLPAATPAEKDAAFARAARLFLDADLAGIRQLARALADQGGVDFAALAAAHMLDWAGLRALAASPLIEIGAHTVNHPALARLDAATARAEMTESRDRLARETGRAIRHFAYPYGTPGTIGAREVALGRELGFASAVSTSPGNLRRRHGRARHLWPRHGVGPEDTPAALSLKLAGIRNPIRGVDPGA